MPITQIRNTAQRLVADGALDRRDVGALIDLAKSGGRVTWSERNALRSLLGDPAYRDAFTAEARLDLQAFLGIASASTPSTPPASAAGGRSLGTNPAGESVVFKGGWFVASADAALPARPLEIGSSVYLAASLIGAADHGSNVFASLARDEKKQLFQNLELALLKVPPDVEVPQGYDDALQARQQRSSIATCLLELMRSLDLADPQQRLLQDSVLKSYARMAEAETVPQLRDSMVFQLFNNKDCLVTDEQREVSNRLMRLFAPTQPPYDEWFRDGNDRLRVVCHTGGEFFDSEVKRWKDSGFGEVGTSSGSRVQLEKTVERNGVKTVIELTMLSGSSGTFEKMSDPGTHVVAYSGHASWGRNIPSALRGAPDEAGQKLVLIHQCCGRGTINKFHDKYPDAQLVTTRNSSYEHEDFNTFSKVLDGIAERRSWASIANTVRSDRCRNSRDNYYFPSDVMLRMRALDADHDGVADVVDRLVHFNACSVATDTAAEFKPRDPGQPFDRLSGTSVHEAAQIMNTTTFSDFTEAYAAGESFIGAGYFQPTSEDDPMVRIRQTRIDDVLTYEVAVNSHYAHASEEAIKAEAFYTVAHTPPFKQDGDSKLETCLKALILVAHSLSVDSGYRDDEIWKQLLAKHGLPEIALWDVSPCVDVNHVYAGSAASIAKLRDRLGSAKLAAIEQALG
ncbi:MAG: hypothetical protein JXR83_10295 [Deltaproteobacteria bacterium]|nr:hypothetical protein [Deltaproteobacteria bacterium]